MLNLITGQPGNGKTLFTLGLVEKLRLDPASVASNREVYQSGIPELKLPWKTLDDPAKWWELPNGSIVVIDECQRVFPPRKTGAAVPRAVSEFETHRHRGFDVFLITQHPQLLDIAVRKLTGRHYHLKRTFGQDSSTLLQWEECTDPNDRSARNKALVSRFNFPKERFDQYKSADMHTVKKELPWKPILTLAAAVLGVIGLGWFAADRLMSQGEVETESAEVRPGGERIPPTDQWNAASLTPRVPHWPWSAPHYDGQVKLVSVPRITGCMSLQVGNVRTCKCYNGQGDANVASDVCRDFMAGRVFDPTREVPDIKAENIARLDAASPKGNGSGSDGTGAAERPVVPGR
jgi:hypothetical protein